METNRMQAELVRIFTEHGFQNWAAQAAKETDPELLKLLAIRAVKTAPKEKQVNIKIILKDFIC